MTTSHQLDTHASDMGVKELRDLQSSINQSIQTLIDTMTGRTPASNRQLALMQLQQGITILGIKTQNAYAAAVQMAFQPIVNVAVRIAIDLDLFNHITERTSLDMLRKKTGGDKALIARVLRLLVAAHLFTEPEEKIYSETPLSQAILDPSLRDLFKTNHNTIWPILHHTPDFVSQNGFRDITSLAHNPTTSLHNGLNFWEYLDQHPPLREDFNSSIGVQDQVASCMVVEYPFAEAFTDFNKAASTPRSVCLVDVGGGGAGHYLRRLGRELKGMPGHNVLQDLEKVINTGRPEDNREYGVTRQAHGFFKSNPVRGAKFYQLRAILHDWPDEKCVIILQHIKDAMKPHHSRLLIHTCVLPAVGIDLQHAILDMTMMALQGRERTQKEFANLLKQAGLVMREIIKPEGGYYCIIDAEVQSVKEEGS